MVRLTGASFERDFLRRVIRESGENLLECLQCGKCSGGCPIASEATGGPRKMIALVLAGMKEQVLRDPTWWYCVSCGTCATRCPVEINAYKVATVLCEIAEREKIEPSEPDIHRFEDLFLKSVHKHGRVRELQAAMAYNIRSWKPFKDAGKGISLILKGAVSPFEIINPKKQSDAQVSRIFDRVLQEKDEA